VGELNLKTWGWVGVSSSSEPLCLFYPMCLYKLSFTGSRSTRRTKINQPPCAPAASDPLLFHFRKKNQTCPRGKMGNWTQALFRGEAKVTFDRIPSSLASVALGKKQVAPQTPPSFGKHPHSHGCPEGLEPQTPISCYAFRIFLPAMTHKCTKIGTCI
jgi:hypothetical protein